MLAIFIPGRSRRPCTWLARVQIIEGEYREAWETLNTAHAKDPDNFYPWYFRSVISEQMRDRERAEHAIDEAEKRVAKFARESRAHHCT